MPELFVGGHRRTSQLLANSMAIFDNTKQTMKKQFTNTRPVQKKFSLKERFRNVITKLNPTHLWQKKLKSNQNSIIILHSPLNKIASRCHPI
jgi:3-hydroxy-3-methylglutaryl CoA synthase